MVKENFQAYIKNNSENISAFGVFLAVFIFINSSLSKDIHGPTFFSLIVFLIICFIFSNLIRYKDEKSFDFMTKIFKILLWSIIIYLAVITFQLVGEDGEFLETLLNIIFILVGGFLGYKLSKKITSLKNKWSFLIIPISVIILIWLLFLGGTHILNDVGIDLALWMNLNILQIPLSNITTFFLFVFSLIGLLKLRELRKLFKK